MSPRRSAILATRDDRGRVLLVRQRGGPFKDAWLLPGGGLENDESFGDALRRELHEETGLAVVAPVVVARYDVRAPGFHGDVQLYRGGVSGVPRAGDDGEPRWSMVDLAAAHPVLLRELRDAGLAEIGDDEIDSRCAALGIRMTRTA